MAPALAGFGSLGHQADTLRSGVTFSPPLPATNKLAHALPNPSIQRPPGMELAISLDQQIYDMLAPEIRDYARRHGLRLALRRGTCGQSAAGLRSHMVDIGGFCCPPGPADRLPGLHFHTLGIGAIAILAHRNVVIDGLTHEQVRGIMEGTLRRLPLTEDGTPVVLFPVIRPHCSSRPGHWHLIVPEEDRFFPLAAPVGGIRGMLDGVKRYIGAIGYETLYWVDKEAPDLKVLRVDGNSPRDRDALLHGSYPYYRVFNVTTWEGADEKAKRLVEWLKERFAMLSASAGTVPADRLRAAGWRFSGDELIGGPE